MDGRNLLKGAHGKLIQFTSPRFYRELWGENDVQSGENVKKGEQDSRENHD